MLLILLLNSIHLVHPDPVEFVQSLFLTDEEKIKLNPPKIAITSNNSYPNIIEYFQMQQQQLINEAESQQLNFSFQKVFLMKEFDQDYIYICFQMSTKIQCNYRIHNCLYNEKIKFDTNISLSFNTTFTDCLDLINYNKGVYLLICVQDLHIYAAILNQESIILDEINFYSNTQKLTSFSYFQQRILFYEYCSYESIINIYSISSDNKFNQNPMFFTYKILDPQQGKLMKIQLLQNTRLIITFEYQQIITTYQDFQSYSLKQILNNDFQYINSNSDLMFGRVNNQPDVYSFSYGLLCFGNSTKIPIDVIQVVKNLVFTFDEEIKIILNKEANLTIKVKHKYIQKIGNLPYILLINEDLKMFFYKIFELPHYIQKREDHYAFVYLFSHQTKIEASYVPYQMLSYSQEIADIIITKKHFLLLKFDFDNLSLSREEFGGLPFNFKQCNTHNQNLLIYSNVQKIDFSNEEEIFTFIQTNQSVFALIKQHSFFQIYQFNVQNHTFNTPQQLSNVLRANDIVIVNYKTSTAFLASEHHLYHYEFESASVDTNRLVHEMHFTDRISQIKSNSYWIFILFENCTVSEYFIPQKSFLAMVKDQYTNPIFFSQCLESQKFVDTQITFKTNTMKFLSYYGTYKYVSFNEIIDCDSIGQYLIVFEIIQKQVNMHIYVYNETDIIKLNELPTYNYQINYPIQKQISDSYLAISAARNDSNVIMIYKISNPTSHSLRKVIQVDKNSKFNFIGTNGSKIYYIFEKQICFEEIERLEIQLTYNKSTFLSEFQIDCQLQSQISNFTQEFKFLLTIKNLEYRIQILDHNYLGVSNLNRINLNNVIGNINDLELIFQSDHINIEKPFKIVKTEFFICRKQTHKFCQLAFSNHLVYEYFLEKNLIFPFDCNFDPLLLVPLSEQCFMVIYKFGDYNLYLGYLNNTKEPNMQESFLLQERSNIQSIKKQVKNLFLVEEKGSQRILLIENNKIQYLLLQNQSDFITSDITYLQYYTLILTEKNKSVSLHLLLNNSYIKEYYILDLEKRLELEYLFKILDVKITKKRILQQIMIVQICAFLQFIQGYCYELQINLDDFAYTYNLVKIIRYGLDKFLIKVLFCNSEFIILHLSSMQMDKNETYNIYNLKYLNQMIDSYYQIPQNNILSIEQLNETHFTMLKDNPVNGSLVFSIIQIEDYLFQCHQSCNNVNLSLLIKNDIKDFQTFLIINETNPNIMALIILTTFVVIVLAMFKKQNKKFIIVN